MRADLSNTERSMGAPTETTGPAEKPQSADVLLTIPQAMARLGVSRGWIYKMRKQGKLVVIKLGGMSRIRSSEVDRLMTRGTELPTNCLQAVSGA